MDAMPLLQLLDRKTAPRVLVLGDLMLDVYTSGHAERISPEAPVIVLRAREQKSLLGGAANVCQMLRGLEAEVSCAGVVGEDDSGRTVQRLLDEIQVHRELLFTQRGRTTTVKERFLGSSSSRMPSQILRVDRESRDAICHTLEDELLRGICKKLPQFDALLISDYAKGVCTPRLVQAAIRAAQQSGVPVLVDPPPGGNYSSFSGATVLKPNRAEAAIATGIDISKPADGLRAARQLCEQLELQHAVVTLDRDGMALVDRQGNDRFFPTTARSVCDITGAGDMVLAVLGLCLASGAGMTEAVQLANVAASLEVQRVGVAVITRDEIRQELLSRRGNSQDKLVTLEQATQLAEMHRRRGEKVVFTNGCFDLLHVGHVAVLSEARSQGDVLFVGLNSDESVRKLKGAGRPVIGQGDRASLLAALSSVGYVIVFDDETPHRLLHAIRPDVLVKGGTYGVDQVVGHEVVTAYGGQVRVTGVVDGVSTTSILQSALHPSTGHGQRRQAA